MLLQEQLVRTKLSPNPSAVFQSRSRIFNIWQTFQTILLVTGRPKNQWGECSLSIPHYNKIYAGNVQLNVTRKEKTLYSLTVKWMTNQMSQNNFTILFYCYENRIYACNTLVWSRASFAVLDTPRQHGCSVMCVCVYCMYMYVHLLRWNDLCLIFSCIYCWIYWNDKETTFCEIYAQTALSPESKVFLRSLQVFYEQKQKHIFIHFYSIR